MDLAGFLKAFASWKKHLERLDPSTDGKEREKFIARFLLKIVLIQVLEQLEAIPIDFLGDTFNKALERKPDGPITITKSWLSSINDVLKYVLGRDQFFPNDEETMLLGTTGKHGACQRDAFHAIAFLFNAGPSPGGGDIHPCIDEVDFLSIKEDFLGAIHEKFHVERKRKAGIYYTPRSIAKYIVKQTVEPFFTELEAMLEDKGQELDLDAFYTRLRDASRITLLDPACGTGIFLVEALKLLFRKYTGILDKVKNDPGFATIREECLDLLPANPLDLCIKILEGQLHGVDLDETALDLARTNLLVEAVKLAGPSGDVEILKKLGGTTTNLVYGNALIGFKKDKAIKLIREIPGKELVPGKINDAFRSFVNQRGFSIDLNALPPVHFPVAFPGVFVNEGRDALDAGGSGFDVIVGNPPFLGYKQYLDTHDRRYLEWRFEIFDGQSDMYYYFFELHRDLLNAKGTSGQITSRYFLQGSHAENLREMLRRYEIIKIVDFDENVVFKGVGIHALIFVFTNQPAAPGHGIQYVQVPPGVKIDGSLGEIIETGHASLIPQAALDDTCWSLLSEEELAIKQKFDQFNSLGDIGSCTSGSETGLDKAFVKGVNEEHGEYYGVFKGQRTVLEREIVHSWVKNRDIQKYAHAVTGHCIYVPPWMEERTLREKFQGVHAYLSRYKEALEGRDGGKIRVPWYVWRRPKNVANLVKVPKLICPYKASAPRFSIDLDKMLCSYDVTVFVLEDEGHDIKSLLGILNSRPVEWYFKTYGKKMGDVYEVYSGPLSAIKVPPPGRGEPHRALVKLVDQALALKKEGRENELKGLMEQIDAIAFHLYSLSSQDAKIILDSLGVEEGEKNRVISGMQAWKER